MLFTAHEPVQFQFMNWILRPTSYSAVIYYIISSDHDTPCFFSSPSAEVDVRIRKYSSDLEAIDILAQKSWIKSVQSHNRIMAAELFAFLCVCGLSGRSSDRQTKQLELTADTASVQIPREGFDRAFTSLTYTTQAYMHK